MSALSNIGDIMSGNKGGVHERFFLMMFHDGGGRVGIFTDEWDDVSDYLHTPKTDLRGKLDWICREYNLDFIDFDTWFAVGMSGKIDWVWERVKAGNKLHLEWDWEGQPINLAFPDRECGSNE